ncbi:MAG: hypothetical protein U5O39_11540 [Gammaproteobacteria bacterium]|nr:hypothetical protein [Gammaproteobacteria bacterium]
MPLFAGDLRTQWLPGTGSATPRRSPSASGRSPGPEQPGTAGVSRMRTPTLSNSCTRSTASTVLAQRVRPGIDPASALDEPLDADGDGEQDIDPNTGLLAFTQGNATSSGVLPNYAFGHPEDRVHAIDREDMDGDDLLVDTNGNVAESFDHNATQFNMKYAGSNWEAKYIFGYTDFTYQRNTDEDFTGGVRFGSDEFFVEQENENIQHEIRLTFDTGSRDHDDGRILIRVPGQPATRPVRSHGYTEGRLQDTASYDGFGLGSDEANAGVFGQLPARHRMRSACSDTDTTGGQRTP